MSQATTQNTAGRGSTVGIQAEQVHNSTVYQVLPGASPKEKYHIGKRFLADGVPAKARDLIIAAISEGHENGEVRFFWVLAMLSKRAYRDLTLQERERLGRLPTFLGGYADDEWKRALEAIHDLLERLHGTRGDLGPALEVIQGLGELQREQIVVHLDLLLTGSAKDRLWAEARYAARGAQRSNSRVERVWAYFQPEPEEALARPPGPIKTTPSHWGHTVASMVMLAGAIWYLVSTFMVATSTVLSVVISVTALGSGAIAVRTGWEWHYRARRLKVKELDHQARRWHMPDRDGEFADDVNRSLLHYFIRYAPAKIELGHWLAATEGIRSTLRDEIVDLYQERLTERYGENKNRIGHVEWLIRYLVREVVKRRDSGTLRLYREQWRTGRLTKLLSVLSTTAGAVLVAGMTVVAVRVDALYGGLAVVVFVLSGRSAVKNWCAILGERRRFADERREYERILGERRTEHQRWVAKLAGTRPDEWEMEKWLTCDKTILLDDALRHYQMAWQDVIAHAFLQTPARSYKRARTRDCPWRYSNYDMRLFLITHDGVREYRTEFDFTRVLITRNERNNFRFDAVSSIGVIKTSQLSYTLKLRLNNGPASRISIIEAAMSQPDTEEDAEKEAFSEINLDAAGFKPTLHILEGIAAEGKGWIERDPRTGGAAGAPADIF